MSSTKNFPGKKRKRRSAEPYPSLSDYHDDEPNLEFDDTELHQTLNSIVPELGELTCFYVICQVVKYIVASSS